ncbi:GNAT family N-acetyltransferase [Lujinxingia litoralis]|nr:GNAT family N-acetyltransferase [Lujinxingia litoralis]
MNLEFSAAKSAATLAVPGSGTVVARIDFREDEHGVFLDYLWTNPMFRGQGYARQMLNAFAEFVRSSGKGITPLCGVARAMMQGDPRYDDLLPQNFGESPG